MQDNTGMSSMRIAVVVGTRPEFIKTWSVVREIKSRSEMDLLLVHTGQHYDYEMSQVFFEDLSIEKPNIFLGTGSKPRVELTAEIMLRMAEAISREHIDLVLVQGDTNSCMAAGLVAVQMGIPLGHIEAGCRSFDPRMPEETNRVVVDSVSDVLFPPSETAYQNLVREGASPDRIFLVGNTVRDALDEGLKLTRKSKPEFEKPYAVATIHRAENTDNADRLAGILAGLSRLTVKCIFPVHPRTRKMIHEHGLDSVARSGNLELIDPLSYLRFISLLHHAQFILTDSGGVQTEAVLLHKPTITIRENTEWPETVWTGWNRLVMPESSSILAAVESIESDVPALPELYPAGAGRRIVDVIWQLVEERKLRRSHSQMIKEGYPMIKLVAGKEANFLMRFNTQGLLTMSEDVRYSLVRCFRDLASD